MESVNFGSRQIGFCVKRSSRRKTVGIAVDMDGSVIVTAPKSLAGETLKEVVRKKARWILGKQDHFRRINALFPTKEFTSGEEVLLLGKRYRLKVTANGQLPNLSQQGRRIHVSIPSVSEDEKKRVIRGLLKDWYVEHATALIGQRVARFSMKIGVRPKIFKVRDQEKRWGSCSKSGVLRFNWKIIMAPASIVDYVAVHELCHLKFQNHSHAFWELVASVLPDYQERREWLKKNAPTLSI